MVINRLTKAAVQAARKAKYAAQVQEIAQGWKFTPAASKADTGTTTAVAKKIKLLGKIKR